MQHIDPNMDSQTLIQAIQNNALTKITPLKEDPLTKFNFDKSLSQHTIIDDLHHLIRQLQMSDYDYLLTNTMNHRMTLVKDLSQDNLPPLNPIHQKEGIIQALRYMRGFILLANAHAQPQITLLLEQATRIFDAYLNHRSRGTINNAAQSTHWLTDQLAHALQSTLSISYHQAEWQLIVCRDLGILLEQHPNVITISKENNHLTVEKSVEYKISPEYYDAEFNNIERQPWFKLLKTRSGYAANNQDTWLNRFFAMHLAELKSLGVSAPPSARWLPIPANNQWVSIDVLNANKMNGEALASKSMFLRTGIIAPYDIADDNEQYRLAVMQLKELIKSNLLERINAYKKEYENLIDPSHFLFFVNYQTLLTPHYGEEFFPHKENSAKFIAIIKRAIQYLENDAEINLIANQTGAKLVMLHSNASVNYQAGWITAIASHEDKEADIIKTKSTMEWLLKYHELLLSKPNVTKNQQVQLITRICALKFYNSLLLNESAYAHLAIYQRNLMSSALEFLMMGSQAFSIVGCKSARDRTAAFAATVKTMQENPLAMCMWTLVENGIIHSLKQGHAFRSMQRHCGIVKLNYVHSSLFSKLEKILQDEIKQLKIFSKPIDHELVLKNEINEIELRMLELD